MIKPTPEKVFEVSWEICNKVGGIWTVISSKAAQMKKHYKDYTCIGPYFLDKAKDGFEEHHVPEDCIGICQELKEKGIRLHFGKWLIKGEPKAILIDFTDFKHMKDSIKREMYEKYKVDSINSNNSDYEDPLVWAYAAGMLIEKLADEKSVVQVHEWLAGVTLLYLKMKKPEVGTVFTTHATVMGRTLASANVDLYGTVNGGKKLKLELMDIDKEAYNYKTEGKHLIEKASANNADVFTTVSEITGIEAKYILGKEPDALLPNGLDMEKFPTFEEESIEHRKIRHKIREFTMFYFFPYYNFNIRNTLFFFLAGRYEVHNKGIDVYLKALTQLNDRLKKDKSDKTIIAFILVPAGIRAVKYDILENRTYFSDIKEEIDSSIDAIHKDIIYTILSDNKLNEKTLFSEEFLSDIKKKMMKFKKEGAPPVVTHEIDDGNDAILSMLNELGLRNSEEDKIKVIFYPIYLTGADSLLDLDYYETMQGCHLGIFPSFYEPWGYTPVEAAALGISSVTTDLAGFGRFIAPKIKKKHPGIQVIKRLNRSDDDVTSDLSTYMYKFANDKKHDRVANKIEARKLANLSDWKIMIENYIKAHNMALEKKK